MSLLLAADVLLPDEVFAHPYHVTVRSSLPPAAWASTQHGCWRLLLGRQLNTVAGALPIVMQGVAHAIAYSLTHQLVPMLLAPPNTTGHGLFPRRDPSPTICEFTASRCETQGMGRFGAIVRVIYGVHVDIEPSACSEAVARLSAFPRH